jgi:hypothetical protein
MPAEPRKRSRFEEADLTALGIDTPLPSSGPSTAGIDPSGLVPEPGPPADPKRVTVAGKPAPPPPEPLRRHFVPDL